MHIINQIKKTTMLSSFIYLIVGLILFLFPGSTARTIGYAFATVVLVVGLGFIYRYITKDKEGLFVGNELVIGIVLTLLSIFIYIRVDSVISIIPVLLGIVVLVSGISKLQNAIGLQKMNYSGSTAVLVFAIINIIFGIILIFNPFKMIETLIMLIGLGLIFSGATDIVTAFFITKNLTKDSDIIDGESREL